MVVEIPTALPLADDRADDRAARDADRAADRAARHDLRAQIVRLERKLGSLAFELGMSGRALPMPALAHGLRGDSAPRLLSLGELEAVRDRLVFDAREAQRLLTERLGGEGVARARLHAMLADPSAHRFERLELAVLGEPGCGAYEVRPRLGLLGMLFGWWCVKLSSGCP